MSNESDIEGIARAKAVGLCISGTIRSSWMACRLSAKACALDFAKLRASFSARELSEMDEICIQRLRMAKRVKRLACQVKSPRRSANPKQFPAYTLAKARAVRRVMGTYFSRREKGSSEKKATAVAQSRWQKELGKSCTEKTIRRHARRVKMAGGLRTAPLEAFMDRKCRYFQNREGL